jgi:hypothetical protein
MLTKLNVGTQFLFGILNIKSHEDVLYRSGDEAGLHTVERQAIVDRSVVSDGIKECDEGLGSTVSAG